MAKEIKMTTKKFEDLKSLFAEINADDSLFDDEVRRSSRIGDYMRICEIDAKRREEYCGYIIRLGAILDVGIITVKEE